MTAPAMTDRMQLPAVLEPVRAAIEAALCTGLLAAWPEKDVRFTDADQAAALGRILVRELHPELHRARIRYLFRETMSRGEWIRLGKAARAQPIVSYLADLDFILTFNWTAWKGMTREQRCALVDHELCHCGVDLEHDRFVIVHHDVEEFGAIVRRWGLWKQDLRQFAVQAAQQLELLPADARAAAAAEPPSPPIERSAEAQADDANADAMKERLRQSRGKRGRK